MQSVLQILKEGKKKRKKNGTPLSERSNMQDKLVSYISLVFVQMTVESSLITPTVQTIALACKPCHLPSPRRHTWSNSTNHITALN